MSNIKFEVNESKLKLGYKIFNNKSLNSLVEGLLKNKSWNIFIYDIIDFFNTDNFKDLTSLIEFKYKTYMSSSYFNNYIDDFNLIASYFYSFESFYDNKK